MKDRPTNEASIMQRLFLQGLCCITLCSSRSSWIVGLCQAENTGGKALDGAKYGLGPAWVGPLIFSVS